MIPFNKPYLTGRELHWISDAHQRGQLAGDGHYTRLCSRWLEEQTGSAKALLTHSCTAALEMAAILANIQPGDEVILPSYTFVSTANAFVLRGGVPVFVDIRPDTLNIDERLIEAAITPRTRAIVPVHYAGVACEMDTIMAIAQRNDILVIEDAAQAIMATYRGKALGSIGHIGCFSFHETKNLISGEGGAILINDPALAERAEIIREKGTNRNQFFRGQVDKYTWVDIGSSYLPGELIAAFLWAQMEEAKTITKRRLNIWQTYHDAFAESVSRGLASTQQIPSWCQHNAHLFALLLPSLEQRTSFIKMAKEEGINCVFHYVPLHSSPQGGINCRTSGSNTVANTVANTLVRLPLWLGLEEEQSRVISRLTFLLDKVKI
jgi:dTDP-4-amino-4,6-dideoxygalactose transaminase